MELFEQALVELCQDVAVSQIKFNWFARFKNAQSRLSAVRIALTVL